MYTVGPIWHKIDNDWVFLLIQGHTKWNNIIVNLLRHKGVEVRKNQSDYLNSIKQSNKVL